MSARAAASRYAKALFEVTAKEGSLEAVAGELERLTGLMGDHFELQRALTNPAVPVAGKRGIVQELGARLTLSEPVRKLLLMLAERDRLVLLPDLAAAYRQQLMDHQQVIDAEITTAVPMTSDWSGRLRKTLTELTGRQVTVSAKVDPSIIGGVVTRIGSTVYDGSVSRQLAAIKQKLAADA